MEGVEPSASPSRRGRSAKLSYTPWLREWDLNPRPLYDPSVPYKNIEDRRAASRRHYDTHKAQMVTRAREYTDEARTRTREFLREAKSKPCTDCGLKWPYYVMQFDHISDDKVFNLGDFAARGYSLASVQIEIAKCELVCANCHAIRTHKRGSGSGRRI